MDTEIFAAYAGSWLFWKSLEILAYLEQFSGCNKCHRNFDTWEKGIGGAGKEVWSEEAKVPVQFSALEFVSCY